MDSYKRLVIDEADKIAVTIPHDVRRVVCKSLQFICLSVFIIVWGMLFGCATLPNVSEILEDVPSVGNPPEIVGARGPLTKTQSSAVIKKIDLRV